VRAGPREPGSAAEPRVFITYRREDTAAHAGRLYDAMVARFGEDNVFMDVDMAPGVDFVERIKKAVGACHVLIVVMGPRWATVKDQNGRARIADPEDFVRLEVETALRRPDVTPIPVLVSGALMPNREDLPEEVRAITRRNALELSDLRWRQDVGRLMSTLDELLAELTVVHGAPSAEPNLATENAALADAAETPGETARPSIATATSTVSDWLRQHLRLTIAGAVVAVAGVALILALAQGGGGPAPEEAGLPEAIPASIRPNCSNLGSTPLTSELGANVRYKCGLPPAADVDITDPSLSYLGFPNAKAAFDGLDRDKQTQLQNGGEQCGAHLDDQIHAADHPDGGAWCVQSSGGDLTIAWDIDAKRSPVMGQATFAPPTTLQAAINAWQTIIRSG
jgi:hypothetical protein